MTYEQTVPFDPQPPRRRISAGAAVAIAAAAALIIVVSICTVGVIMKDARNTGAQAGNTTTTSASPQRADAGTPPTPTTEARVTPTASSGTATTIVVPNGVGMDYQSAQDLWRAAGLHVAPAVDALGAHRLPIVDSNWVVLSQDPAAGTVVEADTFITATVKKFTDD